MLQVGGLSELKPDLPPATLQSTKEELLKALCKLTPHPA
jgi:hypothetical protein